MKHEPVIEDTYYFEDFNHAYPGTLIIRGISCVLSPLNGKELPAMGKDRYFIAWLGNRIRESAELMGHQKIILSHNVNGKSCIFNPLVVWLTSNLAGFKCVGGSPGVNAIFQRKG